MKEPFIKLATESIKRGENVHLAIVFLQNLLQTYP